MEILIKILEDKENRMMLIKEFQHTVWNDEHSHEILIQLAYDLDFYEPNEDWRKEDASYFGDEILINKIKSVLRKISGN